MLPEFRPWIKPAAYVGTAALACALFTAFTPPLLDPALAARIPIIGTLPGDLPGYWMRFLLAFALLGCAPAILARAWGETPASLGLILKTRALRSPLFWALVPVAVAAGAVGALSPDLGAYYPYSRDLIGRVRAEGLTPFASHVAAYVFLYYVPWEFFFRGFLLLPLASAAQRAWPDAGAGASPSPAQAGAATAVAACVLFQTIPSTLLHVGHPLSELAGAVPAGIALGVLAWRTKSIVPGLILHAAIGLGTDGFIVLKGAGYL